MSYVILDQLLNGLKQNRHALTCMSDAERCSAILRIYEDSCADLDKLVFGNVKLLLDYHLSKLTLPLDDLVSSLENKIANLKDEVTIINSATDETSFDRENGVKTMFIKEQFELPEAMPIDRMTQLARYIPTPIRALTRSLDILTDRGFDLKEFTFVDIGAGAGRNLLLASFYPFRQINGIEISWHLNEMAMENIRVFRSARQQCEDINARCGDALTFELPKGSVVLYFFEPFTEELAAHFIHRLTNEGSLRQLVLIFYGAVFDIVKKTPAFRMIDSFDAPLYENKTYAVSIYHMAGS